jgi:hypothetical protein
MRRLFRVTKEADGHVRVTIVLKSEAVPFERWDDEAEQELLRFCLFWLAGAVPRLRDICLAYAERVGLGGIAN